MPSRSPSSAPKARRPYPGVVGHEPDVALARRQAEAVGRATAELRRVAPDTGAYLAESNFFEPDWQQAFWGANHPRLQAVKSLRPGRPVLRAPRCGQRERGAPTGSRGCFEGLWRSHAGHRPGIATRVQYAATETNQTRTHP